MTPKVHGYKMLPIARVAPSAENPRTHSQPQIEQLRRSIREFGFTNPLLVDEDNRLIAGHGRLQAALAEGMTEVPAIIVVGLTDGQRRALLLADNQLALNSGWDPELLKINMAALQDDGFDLSVVGFTPEQLAAILADATPEGETDPEEIPPVPAVPASAVGDLWLLGGHKILCGDSTAEAAIERLMGGQRAVVSVTDPPYSVNYEDSHKLRGGDATVHGAYEEGGDPTAILAFLATVPTDLLVFSYSVNRHMFQTVDALRTNGWEVRKELIWVKDSFAFWAGAAYQQRHEPIWICTRNNASFRGNVGAKQSTVLEYPRPRAHKLHPTAKPIELWKRLIENHSNRGQLIVDPFLGSGTSMICAQMTGRRCYGLELAPQYVDVCVERWQSFTGKHATLDGDGRTFNDVKEQRHGTARASDDKGKAGKGNGVRRGGRAPPRHSKAAGDKHPHPAKALPQRTGSGKGKRQRASR